MLIAALSVVSALARLFAHRGTPVRGTLAHITLSAAMVTMAVPALDLLGPLPWILLLGTCAFWVAGADQPVRAGLPLVVDLVAMACLMVVMPVAVHGEVEDTLAHGHGVAGQEQGWLPSATAVVLTWVLIRVAVWLRSTGDRASACSRRGQVGAWTAEGSMAVAMFLMAL
ncbi:MAG: DUF5134 domain-containing protein [Pseudonocardiaceae bacterium]